MAAASVPAQLVSVAGLSQPGLAVVHGAEQPPVVSDALLGSIAEGEGQSGSKLDLGDIVKDMSIADCEQRLYERVAHHEMALNMQASAEVQASVQRHEAWLTQRAEAEVRRTQAEVHQAFCAHEARQQQLALISHNTARQGEAQFVENARNEMQQFG